MSVARTYKLGLWTLGEHARRNLIPGSRASKRWTLEGVSTRNAEVLSAVASEHGVVGYDDPRGLLESEIDAILIASPNGLHVDQAEAALGAGKHVFVEKSLAPSLADVSRLVALARERDLTIAECFMYRHHPQFTTVKALVSDPDGPLGEIGSIHARFGFPHLPGDDIRYSKALHGGALMDVGAYCLSALDLLLNRGQISASRLGADPGFEIDTFGMAVMAGGRAVGFADWGFGMAYRNELEIWGSKGSLYVPRAFSKPATFVTTAVLRHQAGNREEHIQTPAANPFSAMLDHFASALDTPAIRDALGGDAIRQAGLMEAVRKGSAQ